MPDDGWWEEGGGRREEGGGRREEGGGRREEGGGRREEGGGRREEGGGRRENWGIFAHVGTVFFEGHNRVCKRWLGESRDFCNSKRSSHVVTWRGRTRGLFDKNSSSVS